MRIRHIITSLAAALLLGACGLGGVPQAEQDRQASEAFLTERNAGTPVTLGGAPAVVGTVERVDGSTIVVKSPIDQATTSVDLAADARIERQAQVAPADIQVGEQVLAFGTRQGAQLQAESLQLGSADAPPGSTMMHFEGPPGGPGEGGGGGPVVIQRDAPPPGGGDRMIGGPGGAGPAEPPLRGTVERVEGSTIVVKGADGASTSVELRPGAQVQRQVPAQASDIQVGSFVIATGAQSGERLRATHVQILPAPAAPR